MGKADTVFEALSSAMQTEGAKVVSQVKAVFLFKIKDGNNWLVDLKTGNGEIKKGEGKADCTIMIGDDDMEALASGKLNGMIFLFTRKFV